MKTLSFLSGYKTYIVGVLGIIYAIGVWQGWWTNESEIWGALGFTGAMTIRAAIKKLCEDLAKDPRLQALLLFTLIAFKALLMLAIVTILLFGTAACKYSASVTDNAGNEYGGSYRPAATSGFAK
jgi:hypothetical protein